MNIIGKALLSFSVFKEIFISKKIIKSKLKLSRNITLYSTVKTVILIKRKSYVNMCNYTNTPNTLQ